MASGNFNVNCTFTAHCVYAFITYPFLAVFKCSGDPLVRFRCLIIKLLCRSADLFVAGILIESG